MKKYHRYVTPPIDRFNGAQTLGEFCQSFLVGDEDYEDRTSELNEILTDLMIQAKALDRWEGDIQRDTLRILSFPGGEDEISHGFIWKQANNGTTFVVSPYPLGWLEEHQV